MPSDEPKASNVTHGEVSGSLLRRVLVNTGALSGSSLWRIGISFLLQLLIARILGIQALGIYTVALAFLNVGQVVSELGLPSLLTRDLAAKPGQRRTYFMVSLRVQTVAALFVWAGIIILAFALPYEASVRIALILIGSSLPFYAVTSASETLFRAAERMELVLAVEASVNLLIMIISVVILLTYPSVQLLIGVLVVTQVMSAMICLLILVRTRLVRGEQESVHISLLPLWHQSRTFFALAIAEVLQQRLDILLLSVVAGPIVTGIYSAAYNLVRVAVKLVQSYWQALYPTLSRLYSEQVRRHTLLSETSFRYGLMLMLLAASLVTISAPELIRLIYTAEYAESAQVLKWLIWTSPALFVESYAVIQFMVQNRQRLGLAVIAVNLLIVIVLLPVLSTQYGATGASLASLTAVAIGAITGLALLHGRGQIVNIIQTTMLWAIAVGITLLSTAIPVHWLFKCALALILIPELYLGIRAIRIRELLRLQTAFRS